MRSGLHYLNDTKEVRDFDTKMLHAHFQCADVSRVPVWHFATVLPWWRRCCWLWHEATMLIVTYGGLTLSGLGGRHGPHDVLLWWTFMQRGQAFGSITELDNFLGAGPLQVPDEGAAADSPATQEWRYWNWVTEHVGLPQPPNGLDQRWLLLRTMEPIARQPDRTAIWVLGSSEAVATMRRIEEVWDDLPPYDGDQSYWHAYALHPSSSESQTLEAADWRAILISQNEDAHMARHVPIYYEVRYNVRKDGSSGTVRAGKTIYAPRLITASVFLQMIDLLTMYVPQAVQLCCAYGWSNDAAAYATESGALRYDHA